MRRNRVVAVGVLVLLVALAVIWKLRGKEEGDAAGDLAGSAAHGATTGGASHATGPRAPAAPATLSGRVTRKTDGSGVAGAIVSLGRSELDTMFGTAQESTLTATTNAQGAWTAAAVPPGRYTIAATAKGLLPGSLDKVIVAEGESRTGLDILLDAGGSVVSGTISDVGGGPVPGARIAVKKSTSTPFGSAELTALAGPDGKYEITLADGDYDASVSHEDYTHASRDFAVAGQPLTVDFVLSPGGSIRGVVVTREGKPVPGALVLSEGRRGSGSGSVRTDDKGEFAMHSLGSGAISLNAAGRGYASEHPTIVELGIGEQVEGVRIIVDRAYSISGTVIDAGSKKGIPGVRLGVFSISGGQVAVAPDPSDADGAFEIVGVRPASYMLFALGETTMPEIGKQVEVVDKDITGLVIEMGIGVTVSGRVEPGAVAAISVEPTQVGISNIFEAIKAMLVIGDSDATGAFVLHHVPPGSFKLRAKVTDGRTGITPLLVGTTDKTGVVVKLETRGSIVGKVVDTNNAPVARVHVTASAKLDKDKGSFQFQMGGEGNKGALTTADGTFRIVGLEEGVHELEVSDDQGDIPCAKCKSPKEPVEVTLGVAEAKTGVVLTVEARDGVIKGIVIDKEKKPVADVWITANVERGDDKFSEYEEIMSERSGRAPTLTGPDGTFTFKSLRKAEYTLTAESAKGTARAKVQHVKLGTSVTLALAPLGTLTGKVTLNGAPATAFSLTCDPPGGMPRQFASPAGTYELERIPPGHVKCSASGDAGRGSGELDVPAGPATLDIALAPWATITGTVVSVLDGKPLAGLMLLTDHDDSAIADTLLGKGPTSDSAGRFTISKVAAGKGSLTVMPKDAGFAELAHRDYEVSSGQRLDLGTIKVVPPRTGDAGTLGLALALEGEILTVSSVKPGGPAATAGVQVGDKLTAINGVPVATLTPKLAQTLVSSGSVTIDQQYKLSLERGGAPLEVVLVGVRW